ncbi:hypothetical protein SEA_ZOOMAN_323 [Microbacterium phage Zooman]|nr:hypothetical protein SEA_ZOOMAN_10 [Microbacterium phage Zooman]UDL16564.1 hypothetical protein SEA_ZOOMAN_323 [Microbacterium phage Zooman]
MELLNRENVKAAFEQIIAQYGEDHEYQRVTREADAPDMGCYYTAPKTDDSAPYQPACIIGHVISIVMPETLKVLGELEDHHACSTGAGNLLDGTWFGFADEEGHVPDAAFTLVADEMDEPLIAAVARAQSIQDDGGTWGEAYAAYRARLAELDTKTEA